MLFVQSYESESFFITPAALVVTEPRPSPTNAGSSR
jgi:hypothetical protein